MESSAGQLLVGERVMRRVRYRYLRHLSKHLPQVWYFSPWWRSQARRVRGVWNHAWYVLESNRWLVTLLLILALVFLVGLLGFCGWMVVGFSNFLFHVDPDAGFRLSPTEAFAVALTRSSLLLSLAGVGVVISGFQFLLSNRTSIRPRMYHRKTAVKSGLRATRFLAMAMFAVFAIIHAALCSSAELYWRSLLTGWIVVGLLTWLSYWTARWVGQFRMWDVACAAILIATAFTILVAMMDFVAVFLSKHLLWIGPAGLLQSLVVAIGNGSLFAFIPLSFSAFLIVVLGLVIRSRARSFSHYRRMLSTSDGNFERRCEGERLADANGHERVRWLMRRELIRFPKTFLQWLWPAWFADNRAIMVALGICVLLFQAFGVGSERFLIMIGGYDDFSGKEMTNLGRLSLFAIVAGLTTIELVGFLTQDFASIFRFRQRCMSTWQLWKQVQWFGLARLPTLCLYGTVLIVLPLFAIHVSNAFIFQTMALTLVSHFAVRNFLTASTLVSAAIENGGLGTAFRLGAGFIGWIAFMTFLILFLFGTVDVSGSFSGLANYQIALQILCALSMIVAALFWSHVFSSSSK